MNGIVRGATKFVTNFIKRAAQAVATDLMTDAISGFIEASDVKKTVKSTDAWKKLKEGKEKVRKAVRGKLGLKDEEEVED